MTDQFKRGEQQRKRERMLNGRNIKGDIPTCEKRKEVICPSLKCERS